MAMVAATLRPGGLGGGGLDSLVNMAVAAGLHIELKLAKAA